MNPLRFCREAWGCFRLEAELWLPRRRDEVFPFFADAFKLEAPTPAWLKLEVLTPRPIPMQAGLRIDYRLRLHRVPVRWQSEITAWEPPFRFVDEQRRAFVGTGALGNPGDPATGDCGVFPPTGEPDLSWTRRLRAGGGTSEPRLVFHPARS